MAAIPATGGAWYAPCGVMHALSRVAVLSGLVVAGWLLGSGIALAHEDLRQPGTGLLHLVSTPGEASDPGARATQPDGGSGDQFGVPTALGPALMSVHSAVWAPQRSVPPLVTPGPLVQPGPLVLPNAVRPIGNAVGVPKPLAHVLGSHILDSPLLQALSRPAKYGTSVRPQALAEEPATLPSAKPAVRATVGAAPVATVGPATEQGTLPAAPMHAAAGSPADQFAGQSALGDNPVAPVPASPPASTVPCMTGSTGSGPGTKNAPDLAVPDSWAVGPAPIHRALYLRGRDLPRPPAAQPATAPD